MKTFLMSLILFFGMQKCNSQKAAYKKALVIKIIPKTAFPYTENGKTGLVDSDGNIILPAQFDEVKDLKGDDWANSQIYLVTKKGKFGMVDYAGKIILPAEYSQIECRNDSCRISKDGKYGYTTTAGSNFIPLEYEGLRDISEGKIAALKNGKWGFLNIKNEWIILPKFPDSGQEIRDFSEGFAKICEKKENGKCGFINTKGELVIPQIYYEYTHDFHEGLASTEINGKLAFIDTSGKIAFVTDYEPSVEGDFKNGILSVQKNCRHYDDYGVCENYLINTKGKNILPAGFQVYHDDAEKNYSIIVNDKNQRRGVINNEGEIIIPAKFSDVTFDDTMNLFVVSSENKEGYELSGFYDREGKKLTDNKYSICGNYQDERNPNSETYICIERQNGEGRGVLDKNGKEIIPPNFSNVALSDGIFEADNEGRCAYFDLSGKMLFNKNFASCTDFNAGLAVVSENGASFINNKNGQKVAAISKKYQNISGFSNGVASVSVNGKYGFINTKGEETISPKYDYTDHYNGIIQVKIGEKYGIINNGGEIIVPIKYQETALSSCNGKVYGKNGEKYEWYDLKGKRLNDRIPLQQCYNFTEN